MKIKKSNLTEAKKIIKGKAEEAVAEAVELESALTEAEGDSAENLGAIDAEANPETVGQELADQAEELTDGEVQIDPKAAGELAVSAADAIGAGEVVTAPAQTNSRKDIKVENAITKMLDKALAKAIKFRMRGSSERANVLISGLPGSSKTASVYNWAKHATVDGEKVNISYLNAKNNDLDAYINGYTVQNPDDKLSVTQAISTNLKDLDRANSILFLDEYNRQTDAQIRASLLTLINEHYVVGREEGGKHYFKDFLFTIACMNPALGDHIDPGAAKLNSAETTRFLYTMKNADSDKESCKAYVTARFDDDCEKFAQAGKMELAIEALRIEYLGMYLMESGEFEFSNVEDAKDCALQGVNIINQRLITTGLEACDGDVEDFLDWLENYANLRDEDFEMIKRALQYYEMPTDEELIKEAKERGVDFGNGEEEAAKKKAEEEAAAKKRAEEEAAAAAAAGATEGEEEELEDDDDEEFWNTSHGAAATTASGKVAKSPAAAKASIDSIIAGW